MGKEEANRIAGDAQRRRRLRGAATLMLPTAAALGAGAAIAVGAIPAGDGTITGCYLTDTGGAPGLRIGQLRVIDPSLSPMLPAGGPNPAAVCLSDEAKITWNQSGPAGPQGPSGATGQPGPAGVNGVNGQTELLPAVQFGFDNGAGNMFLKLDGVQGESKAANHKGEIEISSFSFGAGNHATGGGGSGKTSFSSFTITKPLDKSSPLLQQAALSGKHYKEADVFFAHKTSKGQQDYLEIKLDQVLISSYKLSSGAGGKPSETFVLDGIKGEATFISGNGKVQINLKQENTA